MEDETPTTGGFAMTVNGPSPVGSLGPTHIHEHLYLDARPILSAHPYEVVSNEALTIENAAEARWNPGGFPDNYHQTDVEVIVDELGPFHEAGGRTIVDVTPSHLSREPEILRDISNRTGVQVVMGGGYYLASSHPDHVATRSPEDLTDELVAEWKNGADGTGIRPGIIGEVGTWDPLQDEEIKVLRSVAWASIATGLPISIHLHPWGLEGTKVLDILLEEGAAPERIYLGHMNTAIFEEAYQLDLLARGASIGYDLMGFDHSLIGVGKYPPSDLDIVNGATDLAEKGYRGQIFMSQDMGGVKTRLLKYGGWGYAHILDHVVPLLKNAGWTQDDVDTMLVKNPARLLTIPGLAADGTSSATG
jgi:phosphotriesterase-related protein